MSADDFEDDGGTPAWRARKAAEEARWKAAEADRAARLAEQRRQKAIFRWRFRDLTFGQMVGWFLIFPVVATAEIFFGSLIMCYLGMPVWLTLWINCGFWLAVIAGRITTPNKTPASQVNHYRRR